jgi:hypothetical protein
VVLFGIIHEKRDESLECLGKCLLVMKMSLLVKELTCVIANKCGLLICSLGKSYMNSRRHDSYVIVERCNFIFNQTRSMRLVSMLWVRTQSVF